MWGCCCEICSNFDILTSSPLGRKRLGTRMPAQDALPCFSCESLNVAFKRNCSSVLYKVCLFFLFLKRDGGGQWVTALGVTDLALTSLPPQPNPALVLKTDFWLHWHFTGCGIMRITQGELNSPYITETFSNIAKNFMHKYRVWRFFTGQAFFLEQVTSWICAWKSTVFCDRVHLGTQSSHCLSVYGYLLTLTFGSKWN